MILSEALSNGIELISFPGKLFAIREPAHWLIFNKINNSGESGKFPGMLAKTFINCEYRQIFAM